DGDFSLYCRKRILRRRTAREREKSCFWPWERVFSQSPSVRPPRFSTSSQRPTRSREARHSSSVAASKGSMLALNDDPSGRKTGSCGTAMIRSRIAEQLRVSKGRLSTMTLHLLLGSGSRIRRRRRIIDDFPLYINS